MSAMEQHYTPRQIADNFNVPESDPDPPVWNSESGETSTESLVGALVSAGHDGIAFNFETPVSPGPAPNGPCAGLKADVENIPSAPSGGRAQEGIPALSPSFAASQAATSTAVWGFVKWQ